MSTVGFYFNNLISFQNDQPFFAGGCWHTKYHTTAISACRTCSCKDICFKFYFPSLLCRIQSPSLFLAAVMGVRHGSLGWQLQHLCCCQGLTLLNLQMMILTPMMRARGAAESCGSARSPRRTTVTLARAGLRRRYSEPATIPTTVPYCTDQVELCSISHKSFQSRGHTLNLWFHTSKLQVQQQTLPTNPFIQASYCNSCIRPIGIHLLLPNRGSIQPKVQKHLTVYTPLYCLQLQNIHRQKKWEISICRSTSLRHSNWEINSTKSDSNSTDNWFPSIQFFCPSLLYICLTNQYFKLIEIFVIVSFIVQLKLFQALLVHFCILRFYYCGHEQFSLFILLWS